MLCPCCFLLGQPLMTSRRYPILFRGLHPGTKSVPLVFSTTVVFVHKFSPNLELNLGGDNSMVHFT